LSLDEKICLSDYNDEWPILYSAEKEILSAQFPDAKFEHIGSTSVKGMVAKPIIDIMIGIAPFPPPGEMMARLGEMGYTDLSKAAGTDKAGWFYLAKRGAANYNIYLVEHLGSRWNSFVFYRNSLRDDENKVREYSAIKRDILGKGIDTMLKYSEEKGGFISDVMKDFS